jgi:D-glycerate 3-kinase
MADRAAIEALIAIEGLGPDYASRMIAPALAPLAQDIAAARAAAAAHAASRGPLVVGVCGAQGSGKSTAVKFLKLLLEQVGARVAVLSIDDLYLTREARAALADKVHPLFATRGVPGTHDVALGLEVLDGLVRQAPGSATLLPRFDKAADTRALPSPEDHFQGPADIVLFEGWCVSAAPQPDADLARPVNELERTRDPDGIWRRHVNAALAGPYQELFGRIGFQILIEAPGFEAVLTWRIEQERKLRARVEAEGGDASRVMTDAAVATFIQHYERLTRHILVEMPYRSNVTIGLDADRRVQAYDKRLG